MAISKELMDKIIKELESSSFVYSYIVNDDEGNKDNNIKAFRTFDNNENYVFRFKSSEFVVYTATKDSTTFNEYCAKEALKSIQIKNLEYAEKRIVHNVVYPKVHALPEELMKEVLEVFANCQHLTQALTSKIIKDNDENILSYLNMNLNVQYRIYLNKKGLAVILNSQDVVCPDEKEVKKLLNLIRINEYEYHKKLEEFNLKAKDAITYHDMQLKAVI